MRFIFNFIFFGILFYLIWLFFPEAFSTLVSWANHVVAFFKDLFVGLWDKAHNYIPQTDNVPKIPTAPAWIFLGAGWLKSWSR